MYEHEVDEAISRLWTGRILNGKKFGLIFWENRLKISNLGKDCAVAVNVLFNPLQTNRPVGKDVSWFPPKKR